MSEEERYKKQDVDKGYLMLGANWRKAREASKDGNWPDEYFTAMKKRSVVHGIIHPKNKLGLNVGSSHCHFESLSDGNSWFYADAFSRTMVECASGSFWDIVLDYTPSDEATHPAFQRYYNSDRESLAKALRGFYSYLLHHEGSLPRYSVRMDTVSYSKYENVPLLKEPRLHFKAWQNSF